MKLPKLFKKRQSVNAPNSDWVETQRYTRMDERDVEVILDVFTQSGLIKGWRRNISPAFSGVEYKIWSVTDLSGWEFQLGPEFTAYSFIKAIIIKSGSSLPASSWDDVINDLREGK